MGLIEKIEAASIRADRPDLRPGDTVEVSVRVIEGDKERQQKFRHEMPSSYARWFGARRRGPFGGMHPGPNLRLVKMQIRYLVLEREPSPDETLALSLDFARHTAA